MSLPVPPPPREGTGQLAIPFEIVRGGPGHIKAQIRLGSLDEGLSRKVPDSLCGRDAEKVRRAEPREGPGALITRPLTGLGSPMFYTKGVMPGMATGGVGRSPHSYFFGVMSSLEFMACSQVTSFPV